MTREQQFLVGLAGGVAAVLVGAQAVRRRRAVDFAGRTVVITGGSRGLGLVLARQLAEEGARLCLLARDVDELERARQQLERQTADVMIVRCDITRRDDVRAAVDQIFERWRSIDVLINNAGVIQVGPLEHMAEEDFELAMATHFWGPLHLMFEIVPSMRRRGFGRIVNIASIGGRIALPHMAPYTASKFALVGLSDAVRTELAQYGIRVTTVSPGLMRTGSPINASIKGQHEAEFAWFAIADALPGLSISAERAARQIIDACRYGDPELTITPHARLAAMANDVMPSVVAALLALTNRVLPGPAGAPGDRERPGRQSTSRWVPSRVTTLSDRAAMANNEL